MKIEIQPAEDYTNGLNCRIAKGLRKKGIFALVYPYFYFGLHLGFIPVFGSISYEANKIAQRCEKENFKPTKINVGLYK